jgi:hypothetical protein
MKERYAYICGIAGFMLGSLLNHTYNSMTMNGNIDPIYIKPKFASIKTIDRNEDGKKETILRIKGNYDGETDIDLTHETLAKFRDSQ